MSKKRQHPSSEKRVNAPKDPKASNRMFFSRKVGGGTKDKKVGARELRSVPRGTGLESTLFPIVGIGASAGGLEACIEMLKTIPPDTGMAFVIVQHLDPHHESVLPELLSKATSMPVRAITDGLIVTPNCVYVIPPDTRLSIANNTLKLTGREKDKRGVHMPIDYFFRSLAESRKEKSIGVILSGTCTDGTLGLYEVKSQGGITYAQDEGTAKFAGMPRSAVRFGCVDIVLPPQEIGMELGRIAYHHLGLDSSIGPHDTSDEAMLKEVCGLLRRQSGVDFSQYKRNTIIRRIHRHMTLHRKESLAGYVHYLRESPTALVALARDIPIQVTRFFREPESFDALNAYVFPNIMKDRKVEDPIRIWVPACSTGEEVYSIAISLIEYLGEKINSIPVQIFATDISDEALEKARRGAYIDSIALDVTVERLRKNFVKLDGIYQVNKEIRSLCVFAKHDLLKDPPFSRLDLISCRNLLIYLESPVQKRVLSLFHYSLKPHGYLTLGTSETVGQSSELFSPVDKQNKIYFRKATSTRLPADFTTNKYTEGPPAVTGSYLAASRWNEFDLQKETTRLLLNKYTPPCVIVNSDLDILQVHGSTRSFLELPTGKLSHNLLQMVRNGLALHVRSALEKAKKTNQNVVKRGLTLKDNGQNKICDLEIVPVTPPTGKDRYFLVLFHGREIPKVSKPIEASHGKSGTPLEVRRFKEQVNSLKKEISDTREYLSSVIETQEATNEELKAANEEILSSNEELQSANEEIETSKEELQSTNEELNTVNEELQHRNRELNSLNSDLYNLLNAIQVPVVMLDCDLRIKRFTRTSERFFKILASDTGRPIYDIKRNFDIPNLEALIDDVIKTGISREQEVSTAEGVWFKCQILPYRTFSSDTEGAVLAFFNIDAMKSGLQGMTKARDYMQAIMDTVPEPILILDKSFKVLSANPAFYHAFQIGPEGTVDRVIYEIGNGDWNIPKLKELLEEDLPRDGKFNDLLLEHVFPSVGKKTMRLHARQIFQEGISTETTLLVIEDVTPEKRFHELERSNSELKGFAYAASHDLQEPLRMISNYLELVKRHTGNALDQDSKEFIEYAVDSAKRMKSLIDDLLAYSRVGGTLEITSTNCEEVLRQTLIDLNAIIEENGAVVTHDPLPRVSADEVQLRQLFQNLLSNAIKFRGKKSPKVHISVEKKEKEYVFSFKDNGIGFEKQYADKIFDVFQRLHRKEEYPGTGIGLAICKKIVQSHRGSIWAESDVGKGSIFSFSLPLK